MRHFPATPSEMIASLWRNRELIKASASREILGRYRGSVMGILWSFFQLSIPEGLAHGVVVLSETAEFLYRTTDSYVPAHERCIFWNDAMLAIQWPAGIQPILSAKDAQGTLFIEAEVFA